MSRPAPNHSTTRSTYGRRSPTVHACQSASSIIPETFTHTFGSPASARRLDLAGLDVGLGDVVDDEPAVGHAADEVQGGRQLVGLDEDVVREPRIPDRGNAPDDVGTGEPARVGLELRHVPDADEPAP